MSAAIIENTGQTMLPMTAQQTDKHLAEAMALLSSRQFDAALRKFRDILKLDPKNATAHFQIARVLIAADKAKSAISHARSAAELQPKTPGHWLVWAETVALSGDEEDEAAFVAALKKAPIDPSARIPLQDRFGAQRTKSRPKAAGLSAKEMATLVNLMSAARFAEAEASAARLAQAHPTSGFALNILASAQAAQQKYNAAKANYVRAIQVDPGYAEASDNYGRMLLETNQNLDALGVLKRAVTLCPGMQSALLNLAEALIRIKELAPAVQILRRAERQNPASPVVKARLASALMKFKDFDAAEKVFSEALELAPEDMQTEILAGLALAQHHVEKDAEALANFEKVLARDPNSPTALSGKAQLVQTLGQFDEALALFKRALDIDPMNGGMYRSLITSYKVKPGDETYERMKEVYHGAVLADDSRMEMAFAMAKAAEDLKEYDKVFDYLKVANDLARKALPYTIRTREREIAELKNALGDFDYLGAKIPGTTDFAPIFVTGMPRSGTTLIEQIISSHSTVTGAGELGAASIMSNKTLFSNGKDKTLADVPAEAIAALGREYQDYVAGRCPGAERITDKAIQTYQHLGLLKLAMPQARFVIVRRDPRDNLLSIYKNKFPEGTHGYAYDLEDLAHFYKSFVDMIDFWRARVPDWFYEVQYEDLIANPEEETRKLIAACGLEWEDACLNFHENKRKIQTLSVFQARQPISSGSVQAWRRYEKELEPMLAILREYKLVTD